MKRRMMLTAHACAAATLLASAPAQGQEVTFAYRFEAGASERHRVKLNQEVDMGGNVVSNLADMEVTVKCAAVNNGRFEMEVMFDKVDVSMTMFGNTSANPMGESLLGQAIAFTTDAGGEVKDVKPLGVIDAWAQVQQLVQPILESWFPHLPGRAVAVGGDWKKAGVKQTDDSGAETTTNASFKFKAVKKEKGRDLAVVEQVLDVVVGGTSATPMGVFDVAGTGKGKSEFSFEAAKSRVTRHKGRVDLSFDMTPKAGGDAVKMVITNHFERELLE